MRLVLFFNLILLILNSCLNNKSKDELNSKFVSKTIIDTIACNLELIISLDSVYISKNEFGNSISKGIISLHYGNKNFFLHKNIGNNILSSCINILENEGLLTSSNFVCRDSILFISFFGEQESGCVLSAFILKNNHILQVENETNMPFKTGILADKFIIGDSKKLVSIDYSNPHLINNTVVWDISNQKFKITDSFHMDSLNIDLLNEFIK